MKAQQSAQLTQWFLVIVLSVLSPLAMAAGGMESEVTQMITTIRNVIFAVVGLIATVALLWQFAQGFMGRKTWGDILDVCLWIFGAGASISLAVWLFTKGAAMIF